eukprot:gene32713-36936_t
MSLLSGIRYVPKEKKVVTTHDEEITEKKDRKRKSEKRHHSSSSKDKKKRHEKERRRESKYDSDSSDSSVDMDKIAREEEDRERKESSRSRDNKEDTFRGRVEDQWGVPASQQQSSGSKFDPNRFKSLLNSLKGGNDIAVEEQVVESDGDEVPEESPYAYAERPVDQTKRTSVNVQAPALPTAPI